MISYIIVSYNTVNFTLQTIGSIRAHCSDCEIVVVDNASADGTVEAIRSAYGETVKVIASDENLGFSRANNAGAAESVGDFLVFINPDTVVSEDVGNALLDACRTYYQGKDVVLSPLIKNPDGTAQHCINLFPLLNFGLPFRKAKKIFDTKFRKRIPCEWITGVCYGMTRATFQKLNGWNENYDLYAEDLDLCYRLKRDLKGKAVALRGVSIVHYGNQSGKQVYRTSYESAKKKTNSLKKFFLQYYSEEKFRRYIRFMGKLKKDPNTLRYIEEEL